MDHSDTSTQWTRQELTRAVFTDAALMSQASHKINKLQDLDLTLIGIPVQWKPNGKRQRLPFNRWKPTMNWKMTRR